MRLKSEPHIKRSFKNFNQKAFLTDLSKVPFSTAYIFDDPDDVYWCWETLYNQVLDDHAPIRKFYRRPRVASKFITVETRNAMKERDRLKKKYYKSRNLSDWEQYRQMRNKVVSMRRKSIQEHFRKLCANKHANQKKFWSTLKPYINSRKTKNNSRIVIKDNEKIITDTKEVAETLNKYFSSVSYVPDFDPDKPMPDLNHIAENVVNVPTLSLKETNHAEVKEILQDVKINKATGYDLIPPRLVKESAEVLCHPLSTLINYILNNGKIPHQWKSGEIIPVYKRDCELSKTNYRPLTILPSLSKVFEKIVELRMSPHFEKIYHKYVFAYRKHHGCDTAILSLTEEWKKELDNHKVIGLVAMDLSKAFDTLPHDLIVQKLKRYGADHKTTTLIADYLSNRRQRVKLGNNYSSWENISAGIPQGSILGPLLFNIFMNDLAYVIKQSKLSAYADDTQISYADKDPVKVEEVINSDLAKVDQWYKANRMQRNLSKYQAIVMGRPKVSLEFRCENTIVPNCEEVELLGITVDNNLKFEKHVAKVCRKVSQQTAVLKRLRNILPFEIRSNIYMCFIAPYFRYCSETWHFCNKTTADKLEKVHERAIRFVFKDRYTSYEELLAKLGLSTLGMNELKKSFVMCIGH